MRELATVQKITNILPIDGKDRIVRASVNGWSVIVGKGEFKEGDLCVFFEIDSILPKVPQFDAVNKRGNRVRTMRLGGVLSQGYVINMDTARCVSSLLGTSFPSDIKIGTELTKPLSVDKWEPSDNESKTETKPKFKNKIQYLKWKLFSRFKKEESSEFPSFICEKTDETRVENLLPEVEKYFNDRTLFDKTVKMDGQSTTWAISIEKSWIWNKTVEYMCTRNRRITRESDEFQKFKDISEKTRVFESVRKLVNLFEYSEAERKRFGIKGHVKSCAIQAELCGPNIQKNRAKLKDKRLFAFNIIVNTDNGERHKIDPRLVERHFTVEGKLETVPYIGRSALKGKGINDFYADCVVYYDGINGQPSNKENVNNILGEGVVYRNYDMGISFKCVNPNYLIEHGL